MNKHSMNLNPSPFEMIKLGRKTIELRLYDEKRQGIEVGDYITFANTENELDTLTAKVVNLYVFKSFVELYENLPLLKCGYTEDDISSASPADMEIYYSKERQKQHGVVGIEIEVI